MRSGETFTAPGRERVVAVANELGVLVANERMNGSGRHDVTFVAGGITVSNLMTENTPTAPFAARPVETTQALMETFGAR